MSQTSEEKTASAVDDEAAADTFTLKIVSPSTGATGPLSFTPLPTGTTVKELKQKIREALPLQPSDENQRLIHRGRMLARENETMAEIFGQETLRSSDPQTLHLVLRPPPTENATASTTSRDVGIGSMINDSSRHTPHEAAFTDHGQGPAGLQPPQPPAASNMPRASTRTYNNNFHAPVIERLQSLQNLQSLQRDLESLQREQARLREDIRAHELRHPTQGGGVNTPFNPVNQGPQREHGQSPFPNLLAQHERDRAAMNIQRNLQANPSGIPHPRVNSPARTTHLPVPGLHQPDRATTITQQGIGPNGERWHATVTQTMTTVSTTPQNHLQPQMVPPISQAAGMQNMVQAILSAAEQGRITHNVLPTGSNSMNTTSNATGPVETESIGLPVNLSGNTSLPTTTSNSVAVSNTATVDSVTTQPQTIRGPSPPSGPTVYILSSPSGPRALLVAPSETGLDSFFTPLNSQNRYPFPLTATHRQNDADTTARRERRRQRHARHNHGDPVPAIADAALAPQLGHPHNPNAGAAMAQLWPHIWLILRLVGFVWFFTSSNSSWWRTIMVSGVAFVVFLYNTGIFNGVAARVWDPVRGHLEALLPLAGPDPAVPAPAAENNANPLVVEAAVPAGGPAHRAPELDPAQVAAHLMAQRRQADGNWLWAQFRRVEHATILFLASLIPGVGERHIAARAAEDNIVMEADRQREAAVAEASSALTNGATEGGEDAPVEGAQEIQVPGDNQGEGVTSRDGTAGGNSEPPGERLIDV